MSQVASLWPNSKPGRVNMTLILLEVMALIDLKGGLGICAHCFPPLLCFSSSFLGCEYTQGPWAALGLVWFGNSVKVQPWLLGPRSRSRGGPGAGAGAPHRWGQTALAAPCASGSQPRGLWAANKREWSHSEASRGPRTLPLPLTKYKTTGTESVVLLAIVSFLSHLSSALRELACYSQVRHPQFF